MKVLEGFAVGQVIRKLIEIAQPILAVLPVGESDFSHALVYSAVGGDSRGKRWREGWPYYAPSPLRGGASKGAPGGRKLGVKGLGVKEVLRCESTNVRIAHAKVAKHLRVVET